MIYFIILYLLYLLSEKLITINEKDSEITKMVKNTIKIGFILLVILNLYGFCVSNIIYSSLCIYIISYIRNDEMKSFLDLFYLKKENFVQDITIDGSFSRIPNRFRRPDPNVSKYIINNNKDPDFISESTVLPSTNLYDDEELQMLKNSLEQTEWVLKKDETYSMFTQKPEDITLKPAVTGLWSQFKTFLSKFGF